MHMHAVIPVAIACPCVQTHVYVAAFHTHTQPPTAMLTPPTARAFKCVPTLRAVFPVFCLVQVLG